MLSPNRRRYTALRTLIVTVATTLLFTPAAHASGTYTQVICANPDTGQGVATNGSLPSGITNTANRPAMTGSAPATSCQPGSMTGSRGIPLFTTTPFTSSTAGDGIATLSYAPPPDTALMSATLYLAGTTNDVGNHMNISIHGGVWSEVFAFPRPILCEWNATPACTSVGDLSVPFSSSNRVDLIDPSPAGFHVSLFCGIPDSSWTCTASDEIVRLYGGKVVLSDASNPQVSGSPSGGLLTDDPLQGVEDVTVNAVDDGGGLYRVLLLVDGGLAAAQIVDPNSGKCADVNPSNGDVYEFAVTVPCKLSGGGTYSFDTSGIPDGVHNVKVQIEDAAGNVTTLQNRNVTVRNHAVTDPPTSPDPSTGGGLDPVVSPAPTPTPLGQWNGDHATTAAVIEAHDAATSSRVIRTRFGRAVVLSGRLVTAQGQPITGARVDVLSQRRSAGAPLTQLLQVTTDGSGAFRYEAPAGPSRMVRFGYRARIGDTEFARTTDVVIRVVAGVELRVNRRTMRNGQTLRYVGRLAGPATQGTIAEVQVRNGHRWQIVCSVKADARGRFACAHRFTRTFVPTTYTFRARVRRQAGFPYEPARSSLRRVHVRP